MRVERDHSALSSRLRACVCGCALQKGRTHSPAISLGMSESTRDQRMTSQLAPVAVVDLTVPRATEGGKSAKQGKAIEDKGKGKAEEGQDTYGDGGSSGRGGDRGEGKCRHGKQPGKCRECRGEGEAAAGEGRGREESPNKFWLSSCK